MYKYCNALPGSILCTTFKCNNLLYYMEAINKSESESEAPWDKLQR